MRFLPAASAAVLLALPTVAAFLVLPGSRWDAKVQAKCSGLVERLGKEAADYDLCSRDGNYRNTLQDAANREYLSRSLEMLSKSAEAINSASDALTLYRFQGVAPSPSADAVLPAASRPSRIIYSLDAAYFSAPDPAEDLAVWTVSGKNSADTRSPYVDVELDGIPSSYLRRLWACDYLLLERVESTCRVTVFLERVPDVGGNGLLDEYAAVAIRVRVPDAAARKEIRIATRVDP